MKKSILWVAFFMMVTVNMVSCSGGGSSGGEGDPDKLTVTISSPSGTATTTTYTEGSYSTNSAGHSFLNPNLNAYITASKETNIQLLYWDGVSLGTTAIINMRVSGDTPQSYPTGGYVNPVNSIAYDSNNQSYISLFSSTTGTITILSSGNVGEKITGAFDAVVTLLTNTVDILRLSGTFSVTRDN